MSWKALVLGLPLASARFVETLNPSLTHDVVYYRRSLLINDTASSERSVPCNPTAIGGPLGIAEGTYACNTDYSNVVNSDYAMHAMAGGNVDYFTSPAGIYSSGGSNSSVFISGVHATLSNAGSAAMPAVLISWSAGQAYVGPFSGMPSYVAAGIAATTATNGAFPSPAAGTQSVYLSTTSQISALGWPAASLYTVSAVTSATAIQYVRQYIGNAGSLSYLSAVPGFNNSAWTQFSYLSPALFHATVSGLAPNTMYYYIVGNATGFSTEFSFTTPPLPGTYPFLLGIMGDIGQTWNTSIGLNNLAALNPNAVITTGDLSYADTYNPTEFPQFVNPLGTVILANGTTIRVPNDVYAYLPNDGTNQQRWDSLLSVPGVQNLFGSTLVSTVMGNHEIESGGNTTSIAYQSGAARFPSGAHSTFGEANVGDVVGNLYYSQNMGPVHMVYLNSYVSYVPGSAQYAFVTADLAAVNRAVTPWLIVMHHAPLYHNYVEHYKDSECFKAVYEPLYLQYGVDIVVAGHVHAYERTHSVYNYAKTQCAPVYLTIGDGGNVEGPYRSFIDDIDPANPANKTYCETTSINGQSFPGKKVASYATPCTSTFNPMKYGPGYQRAGNPATSAFCPQGTMTFQPAQAGTSAGLLPNPNPSGSGYFCQSVQPAWSAVRDPSFGVATLNILSATSATFKWYRTIDNSPPGQALIGTASNTEPVVPTVVADSVTYTRSAGCTLPASVPVAAPAPVYPSCSPPPPPPTVIVSSSATMTGISSAQFNQAAAAAFVSAIKAASGASAVTVTGIAAGSRRRLQQNSLIISFTATIAPASLASFVASVTGTPGYLAGYLAAAGLPVASVSISGPTPVAAMGADGTAVLQPATVSHPQTLTIQHKALSVGLGVGLSVGVGLPLIGLVFYYATKKTVTEKEAAPALAPAPAETQAAQP